jgi:hypothetical protein
MNLVLLSESSDCYSIGANLDDGLILLNLS